MEKLNVNQTRDMFLYIADKIIESKPFLTEVDSKIGDGDHGIGMSGGFEKAKEKLLHKQASTVNEIFSDTGMTMINSMGGASGIIFGTMFAAGVKGMPPLEYLDLNSLAAILESSLKAIKERGKAQVGDKTMVDALQPAVESLNESIKLSIPLLNALELAEQSAQNGVENTKKYIARFGRAKSLLERAIGYQDAGATSVWIIIRSMCEWVKQNKI
ncbi:MAG: dihydroxyacetone kinase subunit L [Clostridiales bacterium GWC2_40_7]|nr:MAG: dihydroxyacetone kinase subunit L [Clostridiales bacterium GWC2_40_7]